MKKIQFLVISTLLFLFTTTISCKKSNDDITANDFIYKTVFKSGHAGTYSIPKQQVVITSTNEWKLLIAKMDTSQFSEVDIDFNKYTIIAVFDEVKTNGGYAVDISNIVEGVNNIVITVNYQNNTLGGAAPAVLTLPCHIIKIHKTNKSIIFR